MSRYKNIVFDVGSVLVNWMRMNLYTTLFNGNKEKAKWIIDHVVTNEWNDQTDLGKPIDECFFDLKQAYPKYAPYIVAYWYCYKDMDGGEILGIYEIMCELKQEDIVSTVLPTGLMRLFQLSRRYMPAFSTCLMGL